MDLIKSKNDLKWFFYIIISVFYSITQINYLMYCILAYQLHEVILCVKKQNTFLYEKSFFELIIVSLILPDNYAIIIVIFIYYILHMNHNKVNKINICFAVLSIAYILINIIVNKVSLIIVFFAALYILPFVFSSSISKNFIIKYNLSKQYILDILRKVVILEAISIVTFLFSHLSYVKTFNDMDWVVGTLGMYRCNVLMVICSFVFLMFFNEFLEEKKIDYIGLFFSAAIMVSTTSTLYLGVFLVAVIIGCCFSSQISIKLKLIILSLIVIFVIIFVLVSPKWIIEGLIKLLDFNYFVNIILKTKYYFNTFVILPVKEGLFTFLFGVGLGNYASRTAMTCYGGYIGLYDKFFPAIKMFYREKYITSMAYFETPGLAATSESSILAIQGELGLIGLIFIMGLFFYLLKKGRSTASTIVILYFIGLMFVDNSVEYAKYGFIFWLAYYVCKNECFLKRKR